MWVWSYIGAVRTAPPQWREMSITSGVDKLPRCDAISYLEREFGYPMASSLPAISHHLYMYSRRGLRDGEGERERERERDGKGEGEIKGDKSKKGREEMK